LVELPHEARAPLQNWVRVNLCRVRVT